jgi:hypothetical protein
MVGNKKKEGSITLLLLYFIPTEYASSHAIKTLGSNE